MELRHLRYFVAVVEEGSLTIGRRAAAAHLPAIAEPTDSRSGVRGWGPVADLAAFVASS